MPNCSETALPYGEDLRLKGSQTLSTEYVPVWPPLKPTYWLADVKHWIRFDFLVFNGPPTILDIPTQTEMFRCCIFFLRDRPYDITWLNLIGL